MSLKRLFNFYHVIFQMDDPKRKFTSLFRTRQMERSFELGNSQSCFMNQSWKSNPWTSVLGPWLCLLLMLLVLAFAFWFYLKRGFMSFDSHRCSQLPLMLTILILANALSLYCDGSFTSFDPN
ncbi:hypothetical protein V6N11_031318 [Hibiscus sabdariffa]|uniref:Uncharacterized protein n=1 Tax=Hibiscus sabdariffa TaxID=183260 RepID=A0ABR2SY36_9ROSI